MIGKNFRQPLCPSFFFLFCARRDFPSNLRPLTSFICCWNGETKMVDPRGISQLIQSIKLATSLDPFLQVLIWFQDWLRPSPFSLWRHNSLSLCPKQIEFQGDRSSLHIERHQQQASDQSSVHLFKVLSSQWLNLRMYAFVMPRKLVFTIRIFSLMAYLQARGLPFCNSEPSSFRRKSCGTWILVHFERQGIFPEADDICSWPRLDFIPWGNERRNEEGMGTDFRSSLLYKEQKSARQRTDRGKSCLPDSFKSWRQQGLVT